MIARFTCALAALAACATTAHAQSFENPEAIDQQVGAFLGVGPAGAGTAFIPVDRRLRLAACGTPLALSSARKILPTAVTCSGAWAPTTCTTWISVWPPETRST